MYSGVSCINLIYPDHISIQIFIFLARLVVLLRLVLLPLAVAG